MSITEEVTCLTNDAEKVRKTCLSEIGMILNQMEDFENLGIKLKPRLLKRDRYGNKNVFRALEDAENALRDTRTWIELEGY